MLKKPILKKISIMIACLVVIEIISIFPKKEEVSISLNNTKNTGIIYLLDSENFVSRLDIILNSTSTKDKIKEIIDILTINNLKNYHIREGFSAIIPENTKLISVSVEDDVATLDFSKEILNISEQNEEKMIESIVYSLTSLNGISKIVILVDGNVLKYLPNSLKKLPDILNRDIGINKIYDINSFLEVTKTTVYHLAKFNNYIYYVPVTKYSNNKKEKIEIIIDELKSSDTLNNNLVSYMQNETKLIDYNILDKSMILNFNDNIFNDISSKSIDEEVIYTINFSINENYDKNTVVYYVNDNIFGNYSLFRG